MLAIGFKNGLVDIYKNKILNKSISIDSCIEKIIFSPDSKIMALILDNLSSVLYETNTFSI